MNNEEDDLTVRDGGMVTVPLMYALPDGSEALGWATVTPNVKPETLDALRRMMEAAASAAGRGDLGR